MPDGKPANEFAFNGEPKNKEFAEKVIAGTHESWKKLMSGATESGGISLANTGLNNPQSMEAEAASAVVADLAEAGEDMPLPDDINKWHYVSLKWQYRLNNYPLGQILWLSHDINTFLGSLQLIGNKILKIVFVLLLKYFSNMNNCLLVSQAFYDKTNTLHYTTILKYLFTKI